MLAVILYDLSSFSFNSEILKEKLFLKRSAKSSSFPRITNSSPPNLPQISADVHDELIASAIHFIAKSPSLCPNVSFIAFNPFISTKHIESTLLVDIHSLKIYAAFFSKPFLLYILQSGSITFSLDILSIAFPIHIESVWHSRLKIGKSLFVII